MKIALRVIGLWTFWGSGGRVCIAFGRSVMSEPMGRECRGARRRTIGLCHATVLFCDVRMNGAAARRDDACMAGRRPGDA
ncbi:hypothetical protein, partial [Burkholderia dolosa]|uniref:hypothetical protein n=1 Tax=Burkholderia dolosa TaxID=152500 RepID=UPI001C2E235F